MEYITMCLDSTNKLEHCYVRHNNVYCLHLWACCCCCAWRTSVLIY